MIIDTSVILAVLRQEPDALDYTAALSAAVTCRISAANFLEAAIVVDASRDPVLSRQFDEFIEMVGIGVVPVTEAQAHIARTAYRDFGKGSGHPAQLNFGDCFAYALAIESGEPLLFKGRDFAHAGVHSAL